MRHLETSGARITAALVAVVGGSFLVLGIGPREEARATSPPPDEVTFVASCAFDLVTGLEQAQSTWSGIHDGRRFADGLLADVPASDVRAAAGLARRYARARHNAERTARRGHERLARALDRWDGYWDDGFYSPAAFAGLTRAIWQTEIANDAASRAVDFCLGQGASHVSFDAFVEANDAARLDAAAADNVCNVLIGEVRDRGHALLDALDGEAHVRVLGLRLTVADDVHAKALAADGRARAKLLARTYRVLVAAVRRGNSFVAQEQRALRRLIVGAPDGSITNGTGDPIMVYDIRAVLTVRVMGRKQTTHASASDYAPGALPLLVPDGATLDGFDYLVFDRDALGGSATGIVELTYETSIGDVHVLHRLR